jgi:Transglycosylase SLT domain
VTKPGRRTPRISIAFAVLAVLLSSMAPAARGRVTPLLKGTLGESETLQEQVVRLFGQLDRLSLDIENVQLDIAWARGRISELSRSIEAREQILNRRAAEAYMGGFAGGIDSVLGATSLADVGDALEFLDAVSQGDHDLVVALEQRKAEIELQRIRLDALELNLQRRQRRLEATVAVLVEKLQRQRARARAREEEEAAAAVSVTTSPTPTPLPSPAPPSSSLEPAAVTRLIRASFAALGSENTRIALCIATSESGLDPLAVNPWTGAAGVFQFLPSTWKTLSQLAGWGSASVFDARANVAVAAWTVAHYGWNPWGSVAEVCAA